MNSLVITLFSLTFPPLSNPAVIAAQKDLGNSQSTVFTGTGVVRIFHQVAIIMKRFIVCTRLITQHAGHKSHDCIDHHHGRHLATREHIIAD